MTPARDLTPGTRIRMPQFREPLTVSHVYSGPNTHGYQVLRLEWDGRWVEHWCQPDVEFEVVA